MGHMHFNPEQGHLMYRHGKYMTTRMYFPEGSRQEHVDRATFEVQKNSFIALQMNALPMIQKHNLDSQELTQAAATMRQKMMQLIHEHAGEEQESLIAEKSPTHSQI